MLTQQSNVSHEPLLWPQWKLPACVKFRFSELANFGRSVPDFLSNFRSRDHVQNAMLPIGTWPAGPRSKWWSAAWSTYSSK